MLDYVLFAGLFVIECLTLRWAIRRGGLIPFPIGTMGYIICAQTVLLLHAKGVMEYDFLRIFTTYAYIYHLQSMLLLFGAIFFLLTLSVPKSRISVADQIETIVINDTILWMIVIGVAAADIYLFTQFNWSIVWSNRIYLTMAGETALTEPGLLSKTLLGVHPLLGVGVIATCVYAYSTRRMAVFIPALIFALWHFLFAVASHSRYAVAYLLIAAFLTAILSRRRSGVVVLVVLGILTQMSVIEGRVSGHHGFSSLVQFFPDIVAYLGRNPAGAISNFFEGAFVTSEYFTRTFHYATIYKVLSLSPLLSAIDGFGTIRETYEIRLHPFVPVSAITEVLSFGIGYVIVYLSVELLAGKLSADLMSRRPGIIPLILNATVFLGSYLQFTYTTRTTFRIFFFTAVICLVLARLAAGRDRLARESGDEDGSGMPRQRPRRYQPR